MASHGCPILDTLNVIEHDPRLFQISSGLHSIDQVHSRSRPYFGHLENKHLVGVQALTQELVLLNVGLVATASERGNAVHDPKSSNIPERSDVVLDAWELIYLYFLRTRTSSSRSYFQTGAPLGLISNSPISSLLASMTMAKLVALEILSTCSSMNLQVLSLIS